MELRKSGNLHDRELSERVIGAAIEVHRVLGPGFLESSYEKALCVELDILGIPYERQKSIDITYRNQRVGEHRLDLLIDGKLAVELKALKRNRIDSFLGYTLLYQGFWSFIRPDPKFPFHAACDQASRH